eukprot:1600467-Rhodomonas_salina.4
MHADCAVFALLHDVRVPPVSFVFYFHFGPLRFVDMKSRVELSVWHAIQGNPADSGLEGLPIDPAADPPQTPRSRPRRPTLATLSHERTATVSLRGGAQVFCRFLLCLGSNKTIVWAVDHHNATTTTTLQDRN